MNAHEIIIKPVVTEKSTLMQEKKIFAFWVNPKATKIDVKMAIKAIYGADVAEVKIVNTAAKMRALKKGSFNKRKFNRKAYISLVGKAKLDTTKYEKSGAETKVKLAAPSKTKKEAKPVAEKPEKVATSSKVASSSKVAKPAKAKKALGHDLSK